MPPQKRYGFFPAVSAGWVLSEESFIKNYIGNVLSYFKVRGSWGITGNDAGIPYYFYLPAFIQANGRYTLGAEPQNVNSWVEDVHHQYLPNVIWEKSEKTNIGVDMQLFKNHLSISADYFREFTSQILTPRNTVSTLIGYGTSGGPLGNVGKTYNSGFEVEAAYSGRIKDFHWTLAATPPMRTTKSATTTNSPSPTTTAVPSAILSTPSTGSRPTALHQRAGPL